MYLCRANFAVIAQLVEHQLPKLRVASSSLVYRSYSKITNIEHSVAKIPASLMTQGFSFFSRDVELIYYSK